MKFLVVIPARGGSKRLPGKNLKQLGDLPLIVWTINQAKKLGNDCYTIVSTDCPKIAEIARQAGAHVPWLRPSVFATDEATSTDVCLHALNWYEDTYGKVDGLLLLQPTSPFRSEGYIKRGINLFIDGHGQGKSVIGFGPASSHPFWCFRRDGQKMVSFISQTHIFSRSQDLPSAYQINGAFYMVQPEYLRKNRSLFDDNCLPLITENFMVNLDIDTEWDWMIAEALITKYPLAIFESRCMREVE